MPRLLAVLIAALAVSLWGAPAVGRAAALWETLPAPVPLPPPKTSGFVGHDGARIYWASYGVGAPVILLHGGLANSEYWGDQVPAPTQAGYRAIVIDSRGHGRSSRDARAFTYELMASDVVAVMDALKVRRAAIVGWSDGAIIGLVMALRDPVRVTKVFAFAANMDPGGVRTDVGYSPVFSRYDTEAASAYARLSPTPDDFPAFSAAIETMWATEPHYTSADLARIATPVAIVDGDHDEAIKREHTEYLARSIPEARLIILPGVSHFAMLQDPPLFNAVMLRFLRDR